MKQLKKTLLTLVALLALTTQAWAQDVTWTYADIYSDMNTNLPAGQSFVKDGVKVELKFYNPQDKMYEITGTNFDVHGGTGYYEFTAPEGKQFSKIVLNGTGYCFCVWKESQSGPYSAIWEGTEPAAVVNTDPNQTGYDFMLANPSTFEFSFAASGTPVPITWDATTQTATIAAMPAGNVTVNVLYCDFATLATDGVTANTEAAANTDAELVLVTDNATGGTGTLMYYVTLDANFTQDDAIALPEDKWSADVPTADGLNPDGGTYYVWYYIKGDADHSDTDPQRLAVTVLPEPTYTVEFAEGTEESDKWTASPNTDVKKGQTVTVTYTGTKKILGVKAEKKAAWDGALTLEALTDGTVTVSNPRTGMQYSLNGGTKTAVTEDIAVQAGDKVQFYGKGTSITSYNGTKISGGTAEVKVYGNIMSLVDETGFATATTLSAANTFLSLFRDNAKLIDASGLLLPAETLVKSCYNGLFQNCTSLTTAPVKLPAKNLASYCYAGMFNGCSSLTAAPELSATGLAEACYQLMFNACSSLTTAPELKATTLVDDCYNSMFADCSSLTATPKLPATTLVNRCYQDMFFNCTNLNVAYVKAAYDSSYNINSMFYGCTDASTSTFYSDDAASWTSAFYGLTNWQKASYPTE